MRLSFTFTRKLKAAGEENNSVTLVDFCEEILLGFFLMIRKSLGNTGSPLAPQNTVTCQKDKNLLYVLTILKKVEKQLKIVISFFNQLLILHDSAFYTTTIITIIKH